MIMIQKIKYFIARKMLRFINEYHQNSCYINSTSEKNTFVEIAKVFNFQNDPSKIVVKKDTRICGELLIFAYGGNITVGENSYIGENSRIRSGEEIYIGNNVLISHNVNICDTNSHEIDPMERADGYRSLILNGHAKQKGSIETKAIRIEDYAWINFNATILKGVTIGEGAIVAANSVVTKDVPRYTLVAGSPAKVVKTLIK